MDDIGVDVLEDYVALRGAPPTGYVFPNTPNIDTLASRGIQFSRAWVNPACSPTRSCINTGRYAFRHGIGHQIFADSGDQSWPLSEKIIPEMLADALATSSCSYASGVFGKWHMEENSANRSAPFQAGYDVFNGTLFAVTSDYCDDYPKIVADANGTSVETESDYLISSQFADAETWIAQMSPSQPYFGYLAIQGPFERHRVPDRMQVPARFDITNYPTMNGADPPQCAVCMTGSGIEEIEYKRECYVAQTELIDTEIGELLTVLDARACAILNDPNAKWYQTTTIFLVGDNGTPSNGVIEFPFLPNQGKDSAYEGGIRVPFIVAGSAVAGSMVGSWSRALVNGVDIYATVASIAGVFDVTGITTLNDIPDPSPGVGFYANNKFDAVDLSPILDGSSTEVREWIFSELWQQNVPSAQTPYLLGDTRVIMGYFDDGDTDPKEGAYKLWRKPAQVYALYTGSGYKATDQFYELERNEDDLDPDEVVNLVTSDPMPLAQLNAYLSLSASIDALLDPNNQNP